MTAKVQKNKKRLKRAKKTRARVIRSEKPSMSVIRSNQHIYAQVFSAGRVTVVAAASTLESEAKKAGAKGSNKVAAAIVGKLIATRAIAKGIKSLVFDRSGYRYHGCIKALADAAREAGLEF